MIVKVIAIIALFAMVSGMAAAQSATNYTALWYNETSPENVQEFISIIPDCPYVHPSECNRCASISRYIAFEAASHNLTVGTCIVCRDLYGGHQVNTFEHDGVQYYTENRYSTPSCSKVLSYGELRDYINAWRALNRTTLGVCAIWYPPERVE